jgi:hypothetical protein
MPANASMSLGMNRIETNYCIDGVQLCKSSEEKDLGIVVDEKLKFEDHIYNKIKTANKMLWIIKRNFKYLDNDDFIRLYKAFVRSHLEYAQAVWSPHSKKLIGDIERVQRAATKRLAGLKGLTYQQRLERLDLPTLACRRLRGDFIEVYKIMNEVYDPTVVPELRRCQSITRGHGRRLYMQQSSKNIRRFCFSVRVVARWNSLPEETVESPTLNVFKDRIDEFLKDKDICFNYKGEM